MMNIQSEESDEVAQRSDSWTDTTDSSSSVFSSQHIDADISPFLHQQPSMIKSSIGFSKTGTDVEQKSCKNDEICGWIITLSFLIVITLALLISYFDVRYSIYSPRMLTANAGDQILVPISTYFNEEVKFRATETRLKLYVFPKIPTSFAQSVYNTSGAFSMAAWTYQYWSYNLLAGTTLKISLCTDLQIQFYMIRGKAKLKKWTQQILYNNYDHHKTIFPKQTCSGTADYTNLLLRVVESDVYFILFSSSAGWRFQTDVNAILHFNRTIYDVRDAKYSCEISHASCVARLDEASTDISLIEAQIEGGMHPFQEFQVWYYPMPRLTFYAKYFGFAYVTFILIAMCGVTIKGLLNFRPREEAAKPFFDNFRKDYSATLVAKKLVDGEWLMVSQNKDSDDLVASEAKLRTNPSSSSLERLLANDSVSSRDFLQSQRESGSHSYRTDHYDSSQQLLDACMASAGTSAV